MNSLVSLLVSMIVSLMSLCLRAYLVAVVQAGRRDDNDVLPADEAVFDANALPAGSAGLHRAAYRFAIEHHKDGAIFDRRGGHHPDGRRWGALARHGLPVRQKPHAGVHPGPQMVGGPFDFHFD